MRGLMLRVWELVRHGIQAGPVVITLARESKNRQQEKKYHALINDIAKQITFFGTKRYRPEIWKALLVEQFDQEMKAMGTPLSKPGRLITSLDGQRTITVRPSTTDFRKHEAAAFIEYLYAQGCEMGVQWGEPALAVYAEYKEAQAA
jgi:hypothetical protein